MSVRINAARLDYELARRGWSATDLARAAGCSASTISGLRRGRPVNHETLRKIAAALDAAPIAPGIDLLLDSVTGAETPPDGRTGR
jgi:transcriptional regulator with XRE-family HTH domain